MIIFLFVCYFDILKMSIIGGIKVDLRECKDILNDYNKKTNELWRSL